MIMSGDRIYAPSLYFYGFELKNEGKPVETQQIYQHGEKLLNQSHCGAPSGSVGARASGVLKSPPETPQNTSETTQENPNMLRFFYEMTPQKSQSRFAHKIKIREKDYPVWGYANYQEIDQSYGLWFNLHIPEREAGSGKLLEVPIEIFREFSQNYPLIIDRKHENNTEDNTEGNLENFIGQTLLVTSLLTPEQKLQAKTDQKYLKSLSDLVLSELLTAIEIKPSFKGEGRLLGSPVFEYGLTANVTTIPHILIWFLVERQIEQVYQKCQREFFQLFFYSHQIVAVAVESEKKHDLIAEAYHNIHNQISQMERIGFDKNGCSNQVLECLWNQFGNFPQLALGYAELLRDLETLQEAIAFSRDRYQQTLQRIDSLGIKDESSVKFLSRFIQKDAEICQKKLQSHVNKFKPGQFLLEQTISSMRGLIELAQLQRRRRLETQLQALAAGLGMAGIIAASLLYIIVPDRALIIPLINLSVHPFFASVILSLAMGFGTFSSVYKYLSKP